MRECGLSQGSQRLHPARPLARAVFKAGFGRDGRGLAGKSQGKGKGTGADAAMDNSQLGRGPCNAHS